MRFRLVHKLATFLLSGTAIFTLASSGMLSVPILLLVGFGLILGWQADPDSRIGLWFERVAGPVNVATLLLLAFAVFRVARSFPEVDLSPFLYFVLFLLVLKLCQRRAGRDHLQIFILSFLVMLAAAWMATSVIFVLGFAAYGILATWSLVLFHLRREIEENYIVRHSSENRAEQVTATRVLNSRRVVGFTFFAATGAVALLVLVGAGLVFTLIPRVGLGFVLGGVRRQVGIAGFTDQVKLGMHGSISTDNQTVVLRSEIPMIAAIRDERGRDQAVASLYWRGTVYDTYQKGEWLRSRDDGARTLFSVSYSADDLSRNFLLLDPFAREPNAKAPVTNLVRHSVEVVALSHPVAFALDHPAQFEIPQPPSGAFTAIDLEARWSDEVSLRAYRVNPANPYDRRQPLGEFLGATYRVLSRGQGAPAHESLDTSELPARILGRYLQVPDSLTPRVRDLVAEIVAGQTSPRAKAQAVVAWLLRTHGYTTRLRRDTRVADPLEDFLLVQKAGHCEYFASSAAILLRLAGVPTRYVNGFLGGEWNDLRQMVTVRENRAHSWIEAYLGREGWMRVDATPPSARTTRMGTLSQILDSAELLWGRWVIEYSASQQLLLAQRLGKSLGFSSRGYHPGSGRPMVTKRQAMIAAGILIVVIVLANQRRRIFRRRVAEKSTVFRRHGEAPIARVYRSTLDRLAKSGLARMPSETPHEYAKRMEGERLVGASALADLTEVYAAARYGGTEVPHEVLARLRKESSHIGLSP